MKSMYMHGGNIKVYVFSRLLLMLLILTGCGELSKPVSNTDNATSKKEESGKTIIKHGEASYYGNDFHGKKTASGEIFDQNKMTAASPTLPLGSKAEVTDVKTGKSVDVTITDRGPYVGKRVIDLSKAAAKKIGITKKGKAQVEIKAKPAKNSKKMLSSRK